MKYNVVLDCESDVFSCWAKDLKTAKGKITRFIKRYPYSILSATVYMNHKEVYKYEV